MGVEPIQVFSGGAPIKVRSEAFLGFLRSVLSGNLSSVLQIINVLLVGLSISNTREDVVNFGSGQYAVSQDIIHDALTVFQDDTLPSVFFNPDGFNQGLLGISPTIAIRLALEPLSLFANTTIDLFSTAFYENDNDPCVNKSQEGVGVFDKLCEALDANDLTKVVEEADYMIDLCHSLTDELASYRNVPTMFDPSFVTIFNLTDSSHGGSNLPCGGRIMAKLAETPLRTPKLKNLKPKKPKKPKKSKKTKKPKKSKKSKKTKKPKKI